jgi:hypothetical protein
MKLNTKKKKHKTELGKGPLGSKYLVKAPFGLRIDILSKGSCCVYSIER